MPRRYIFIGFNIIWSASTRGKQFALVPGKDANTPGPGSGNVHLFGFICIPGTLQLVYRSHSCILYNTNTRQIENRVWSMIEKNVIWNPFVCFISVSRRPPAQWRLSFNGTSRVQIPSRVTLNFFNLFRVIVALI